MPASTPPPTRPRPQRLRAADAVRLALAAQGLGASQRRPGPASDRGHLRRLVERLGAVQIDSVNVLARAHLLPFRSRLGDYEPAVLARATRPPAPVAWEYWGHEASLVSARALAALRWRMHRAEEGAWGGMVEVVRRRPELLRAVLDTLADGPMTGRRLQHALEPGAPRPSGDWGWNWSDVKQAVEYAFWSGQVACAGRTEQFERLYDLPVRVWPAEALDGRTPSEAEAADELVDIAAAALGVATVADLRDHFRLPAAMTVAAVGRLVEAGTLVPVEVEGWDRPGTDQPVPAWRHRDVALPRAAADGRASGPSTLLAPFDPLVWFRPRTERLFGFRYRLEIYVPAAKRVHGYYVLPFLHAGRLVARVDLKADRARGRLLVRSAWGEPWTTTDDLAALAAECRAMAAWSGLGTVEVSDRGDASAVLAALLRA